MKNWKRQAIENRQRKPTLTESMDEKVMDNSRLFKMQLRKEMGWEEFDE